MKLLSEIQVRVRKGFVPGLISAVYRSGCTLYNLQFIEEKGPEELFRFEISYSGRHSFTSFMDIMNGSGEKYHMISLSHTVEETARGGLFRVSGKLPLENMTDYQIAILGAREVVAEKIREGLGRDFSSISRNIALVTGMGRDRDIASGDIYSRQADAECEVVVLSRFTDYIPFPVVVEYSLAEDFIHVLKRIQGTFRAVRIRHADGYNTFIHEQMGSDLGIPVVSRQMDEIPLYMLAIITRVVAKHKQKLTEAAVGILGLDSGMVRLASLIRLIGCGKVLGFDYDDRLVLDFENQGGLGTTVDNIVENADILFLHAPVLNKGDEERMRPGQIIISSFPDALDRDTLIGRGVREYIVLEGYLTELVAPALLSALIDSGSNTLSDEGLVQMANRLSSYIEEDFSTPDFFELSGKISEAFKTVLVK